MKRFKSKSRFVSMLLKSTLQSSKLSILLLVTNIITDSNSHNVFIVVKNRQVCRMWLADAHVNTSWFDFAGIISSIYVRL